MGEWPEDWDVPEQVFVADNLDASEIAARGLCLPLFPGMSEDQRDHVIAQVASVI